MTGIDRAIQLEAKQTPKDCASFPSTRHNETYHDVGDYSVSQSDWSVEARQFGAGTFKATREVLTLGQMTIVRECINTAVVQDTASPKGSLCLLFPRQSQSGWRVNAHHERDHVVAIRQGETELLIQQGEDSEIITVEMPLSLSGFDVDIPTVKSRAMRLYDSQLVEWLHCLLAQDQPMTTEMAEALEDILFLRIMQCRHHFESDNIRTLTRPALLDLLKKIERHLKSADERSSTLTALAQSLGTAPAEISDALQKAYGYKAELWLRIMRLNGARQDLIRSVNRKAVTETATGWGFFHLGRFAMEYKALFGEGPQETLLSR
jgi:AraC family transcriptional regulator, ethanolamine operon transcriptional activator